MRTSQDPKLLEYEGVNPAYTKQTYTRYHTHEADVNILHISEDENTSEWNSHFSKILTNFKLHRDQCYLKKVEF